jgi:hypothetical protein
MKKHGELMCGGVLNKVLGKCCEYGGLSDVAF